MPSVTVASEALPRDVMGGLSGVTGILVRPNSRPANKIEGPRVLVGIPVRNEERYILRTVTQLRDALDEAGLVYQLAVAEDGSTDGTKALLNTMAKTDPAIHVTTHVRPKGRGRALRDLWSQYRADYYAFCDADLPFSAQEFATVMALATKGAPIVVGSRYIPGAKVNRPPVRQFVSRAYNRLVNLMFPPDNVQDHQCGLKVFRSDVLERLLPLTSEDSWFWDTEILVLAAWQGIPVLEIPIHWREGRNPTSGVLRLTSDVLLHGGGLLRLKARASEMMPLLRLPSDPEPITSRSA